MSISRLLQPRPQQQHLQAAARRGRAASVAVAVPAPRPRQAFAAPLHRNCGPRARRPAPLRYIDTARTELADAHAGAAANNNAAAPPAQRAAIIGAGPAGLASAMYLARRGYAVDVYERRPPPAESAEDLRRTYLIGVGERAMGALRPLGVAPPDEPTPGASGVPAGSVMRGSSYVMRDGRKYDDAFTRDSKIVGVTRHSLVVHLLSEAARLFPGRINLHWRADVAAYDLERRRLLLASPDGGEPTPAPYDLLVGADGAASAVRNAMQAALGPDAMSVRQLTSPVAAMEYKAFHGLPSCEQIWQLVPGGSDPATRPDGMWFFAFNAPTKDAPSPGSISLYRAADGSWAGVMFLAPGRYEKLAGDDAAHAAVVREFVAPGVFPGQWVPAMATQMAALDAPNRIRDMNYSSRIAAPELGVVLIGDAAHNVTPQMGQGCNSALEDCRLLDDALGAAAALGGDLASGLAAFEAARLPQVHALQEMEEENAWVRRPAAIGREPARFTIARTQWLCFMALLPLARVAFPAARLHASLFQNIMASTAPYDRLRAALRASPFVAAALVLAVGALVRALLGAMFVASRALLAGGA